MKKILFVVSSVLLIVGTFSLPISADDKDNFIKFKGGIGVIPVSGVAGTANPDGTFPNVNRNIVRGVDPAGQVWVIDKLEARVKTNGDIKVKGKGLILGGGNNAGRATGQRVFATLICEAAAPFTQRNTNLAGVPLTNDGDFEINDPLAPWPSADCASPMLLIRNAANGGWFAVGILDD
jgi:hypothetical protein